MAIQFFNKKYNSKTTDRLRQSASLFCLQLICRQTVVLRTKMFYFLLLSRHGFDGRNIDFPGLIYYVRNAILFLFFGNRRQMFVNVSSTKNADGIEHLSTIYRYKNTHSGESEYLQLQWCNPCLGIGEDISKILPIFSIILNFKGHDHDLIFLPIF